MKGIIEEGEQMVDAKGDPAVKDAALIAAAQRVEHYERAGYGTARTFALQFKFDRTSEFAGTNTSRGKDGRRTADPGSRIRVNVSAAAGTR
jgi:hypothetical protein